MRSSSKTATVILLLLIVLGSFLRLYRIDGQSLWLDELSSWHQSSLESLSVVIKKGPQMDVHPPGYQIILYFLEKYIGDSESLLRLPSAIAGILSIYVIFIIGTHLYSHKEGLIAAALLAVSRISIFYSQEARSYSLLLLFTLIATYFWIRLLQNIKSSDNISYYTGFAYIAAAVISSYLHYFGLYLISLQCIWIFVLCFKKAKPTLRVLLIYISILLFYLPWLPTMWSHVQRKCWMKTPTIYTIAEYFSFLFNHTVWFVFIALGLLSFLVFKWYTIIKSESRHISLFNPNLLLLLWLVVPFSLVYLKSILSTPILSTRNLIISLPAAYILLARSITTLPVNAKKQAIFVSVLCCLTLTDLFIIRRHYFKPIKTQFREAVEYTVKQSKERKNSIIIGYNEKTFSRKEYFNYYFKKENSSRRIDLLGGDKKDIPVIENKLKEINPQYILYVWAHTKPSSEFLDFLNASFKKINYVKFVGAGVWLFE